MKVSVELLAIGIAALVIAGCKPTTQHAAPSTHSQATKVLRDDALVQFSLVAALAAGDYAGGPTIADLLRYGDFGVGTFSRLDGEMIVLDGKAYQALADGTVRAARLTETTPFAAVKFFQEDGQIDSLAAATLDDLDAQLDSKLPHRNLPYALRLDADFARLTLRSVPPQSPPFRPLVEVIQQQVTHEYRQVRGTLVGLRCPAWVGTLNVAGYHWHYLSEDRRLGGHVLACEFRDGVLRFDECSELQIRLPRSPEFDKFDAAGVKKQDIDQIERQRAASKQP